MSANRAAAAAPGARRRSTGRSAAQPASTRTASRFGLGHEPLTQVETVATECPVALVYNGVSHAVMMASPTDLEDMGRGFTLAEGIVADPAEIASVEVLDMVLGFEIRVEIPADRAAALDERRRSMVGGSACGLCGVISLDRAIRPLPRAKVGPQASADAIRAGLAALPGLQALHRQTGAVHAAAMASPDGEILLLREDVGRHNALDKLIGWGVLNKSLPYHDKIILVSGRASYELLQKCRVAGAAILCAVSAPSSLAVELAEGFGMTLIGFLRGARFNVYTGFERIAIPQPAPPVEMS